MKALFPTYVGFVLILLIVQTYLLISIALLVLRYMKLLKRPYSGMDDAESLFAAIIIAGVLALSSTDAGTILQAAKIYSDSHTLTGNLSGLFFARSFMIILLFSLLFIIINFLNIRFLFRVKHPSPSLSISILHCSIAVGFGIVCWFVCREVIYDITPRWINFQ